MGCAENATGRTATRRGSGAPTLNKRSRNRAPDRHRLRTSLVGVLSFECERIAVGEQPQQTADALRNHGRSRAFKDEHVLQATAIASRSGCPCR